jgi:multiple sugar transport system substrate-binding protein
MKRKVVMAIVLMLVTATVVMAGGGRAAGSGKTKLSFWKSPHSNREAEIWKPLIEMFTRANPSIEVEHLVVPWDVLFEKEMAAFSAGTPPDVSYQTEWFLQFTANDMLMDLSPRITAAKKSAYPKGAWDYLTEKGKVVGLPFIALNFVMFYNKDLFASAGITKLPETWDELVQTTQKLTKDLDGDGKWTAADQYGIMLTTLSQPDYWQALNFIVQAGGDMYNADRTNIGFNNPAGIAGLQFYVDLFLKYKVTPLIDTYGSGDEQDSAFPSGKIGMVPGQIQGISEIRSRNPKLNVGAFLLPRGPARDEEHAAYAYGGMGMLSIAEASKAKDAAWTFLEFITRPEVESKFYTEVGFFSPQPATNRLMYQDDEVMKVAAQGIEKFQSTPASLHFEGLQAGIPVMLEKVLRGLATPAQAVRQLEADINSMYN